MPTGFRELSLRCGLLAVLLGGAPGLVAAPAAPAAPDALSALDQAVATAEASLAKGDLKAAETHYGDALFQGWMLEATLERLEGRRPAAQEALHKAAATASEDRAARLALASAYLQLGEAAPAAEILTALAGKDAHDIESRRLLARALAATGRFDEAALRLDEATAAAGDDPELVFMLGNEYLWVKKVEPARRLFARVAAARPLSQTHILIGRAYRDAAEYELARVELRAALRQDPTVRRAHYYLGMVAIGDPGAGPDRVQTAIAEFREELKLEPHDPLANDQLGVALLEGEHPAEGLAAIEIALHQEERSLYLLHRGRCQLALGQTADAVASLRRALEQADAQGADGAELQKIHYQLGLALRKLGRGEEAATHLAEARRLTAAGTAASGGDGSVTPSLASGPGSEGAAAGPARSERPELRRRVEAALARSYFNLGVIQAQPATAGKTSERFARAAGFFASAAELEPDFPKVQASLGVAYFNAREFEKASAPLERALAQNPGDRSLRTMLAMSLVNAEKWDDAARWLKDDPERASNPSLQFAYGLALVRGGHGAEGETVLSPLIAQQGDSAGLRVLLGKACALQGKHAEALAHLQEAARLAPDDGEIRAQVEQEQGRDAEAGRRGRPVTLILHALAAASLAAAASGSAAAKPTMAATAAAIPDLAAPQRRARDYFAQKRDAEAIAELRRAAKLGALERDLALRLAAAERADGNLAAAERQLRSVADRFQSVQALLQLARVQSDQKNVAAALASLRRARILAPNSEDVLDASAETLLASPTPDDAIPVLDALTRLYPTVARYQYLEGTARLGAGDAPGATEALQEAARLQPDQPPTLIALGQTLLRQHLYAEARSQLLRGLSLSPDDLEATAALAEAEAGLGELAEAEAHARRVLARSDAHVAGNLALAAVLVKQERFADARDALLKIAVAVPPLSRAEYEDRLALVYERLGDSASAQTHRALARERRKEADERLRRAGGKSALSAAGSRP